MGNNSVLLTVVDTHGAAAQATASVTVLNPGFTLVRTRAALSMAAGQPATQHITFTPAPGIGAPMTLACSNLPDKSACSFSPPTLPAGTGSTDVTLTISTTATTVAFLCPRSFYATWLPFTGLGLFGIAVMAVPTRRRRAAAIILVLLGTAVLALLTGCGGGGRNTYPVTPQRTYTVTVAGTSGNLTETTTFSLTVN